MRCVKKAIDQSVVDRMNATFSEQFGNLPDPNDTVAFEEYKARLLAAGHNRSVIEIEGSVDVLDDNAGDHIRASAESKAVKQEFAQKLLKTYTKRDASNRVYKNKNALLIGSALIGLPLVGFLLFASSPKKEDVVVQPSASDTATDAGLLTTDGQEIAGTEIPQAPVTVPGDDLGDGLDTTPEAGVVAQPPQLTTGEQQDGAADSFVQPGTGLDTSSSSGGSSFTPPQITAPAPQTQRDPEYVPSSSVVAFSPSSGLNTATPGDAPAAAPKTTSGSSASSKPTAPKVTVTPPKVVVPPASSTASSGDSAGASSGNPYAGLGLDFGGAPVLSDGSGVPGANPAVDPNVVGTPPGGSGGAASAGQTAGTGAPSGMRVYNRQASRAAAGSSGAAASAPTAGSGSGAAAGRSAVTAYRAAPKPAAAPTVYIAPPVARPVTVYGTPRAVASAPAPSRAAVRVGGTGAATSASAPARAASEAPASVPAPAAPAAPAAAAPQVMVGAERPAAPGMTVYRRTTAPVSAAAAAGNGAPNVMAPNAAGAAASAARPATVIYSRTSPQVQAAATQGAAPVNGAASASALTPGTAIPAVLTGDVVTALGASVPVVVRAVDGNLWIGVASIDGMKRMQVLFVRMVTPSGQVVPMRAMAFDTDGKAGLSVKLTNKAPSLVNDLLRAAISGIDRYVSTLASSKTVTVSSGVAVQSDNVPTLGETVLANTSGIFKLPETGSTFIPVGEAASGTRLFIMVDVTASETGGAATGANTVSLPAGADTTSR